MKLRFGTLLKLSAVIIIAAGVCSTIGCDNEENEVQKPEPQNTVIKKEPARMAEPAKTVALQTSMGNIVIELDDKAAPVTVGNFLEYVEAGFFDGTIFHRVIPDFMIQCGGFTSDMQQKKTREPIVNEGANGLKNERGTLAMARTNDPDSATSQFFINLKDNDFLNYVPGRNAGYAVFGKVVSGMEVVDKIAGVKTTTKGQHGDVPAEAVVINTAGIATGQ